MYTWGYIKENTLNKLNITAVEANDLGLLSRFHYYANEAITQICSAVKPKETYLEKTITSTDVGVKISMPDDFVCFSDAPISWKSKTDDEFVEVCNEVIEYQGYREFSLKATGIYRIPYEARWYFFTSATPDGVVLPIPADICDALPSYIASQCFKIDDEVKAAIYRNEYEFFLARINDSTTRRQGSFYIGGGW